LQQFPRWASGLLLSFTVFALLAVVLFRRNERLAVRKAQSLLAETRALTPGETTEATVAQLTKSYGGGQQSGTASYCPGAKLYVIRVGNPSALLYRIRSRLSLYGVFPSWSVTEYFWVADEKLCGFVLGVSGWAAQQTKPLPFELAVTSIARPVRGSMDGVFLQHSSVERGTNYISVFITNDATSEQHTRAFDLNLRCLAKFRGCRSFSELAPGFSPPPVNPGAHP
jgi:hypothetical protein